MQTAVKVLRRVHDGELPFDRTVQVSVTDQLEKHQILGRLPHNLRTLETLLKRNQRDYNLATSKSRAAGQRRAAWRRAGPPPATRRATGRGTRPADAADRADDQDPRRVQPPGRRAPRADSPVQRRERRRQGPPQAARAVDRRVSQHPAGHAGIAHQPAQAGARISSRFTPSTKRPSAACRKATCGWWFRSPRSTATAA